MKLLLKKANFNLPTIWSMRKISNKLEVQTTFRISRNVRNKLFINSLPFSYLNGIDTLWCILLPSYAATTTQSSMILMSRATLRQQRFTAKLLKGKIFVTFKRETLRCHSPVVNPHNLSYDLCQLQQLSSPGSSIDLSRSHLHYYRNLFCGYKVSL